MSAQTSSINTLQTYTFGNFWHYSNYKINVKTLLYYIYMIYIFDSQYILYLFIKLRFQDLTNGNCILYMEIILFF